MDARSDSVQISEEMLEAIAVANELEGHIREFRRQIDAILEPIVREAMGSKNTYFISKVLEDMPEGMLKTGLATYRLRLKGLGSL